MNSYNSLRFVIITIAATALLIGVTGGCSKKDGAAAQGRRHALKFHVAVSEVASKHVQFSISAVGSIQAFEIVQVTARVPGVIERLLFQEGKVVSAGQPLVEIDPERYELDVQSAQAQLEKSRAETEEAQAGLTRREELNQRNPDLVKREDIDAWRTRVSAAKANLAQAETSLRTAQLNLEYARAAAPLSGVIQTRDVQTGQYVQPGTVIATLVRRDPLLLKFSIPELDAMRVRKGMDVFFVVRGIEQQFRARITAVAESADETTRMVAVTAEVTDENRASLRPGSFAEVTVELGESADLPVIPQTAIRPTERGFVGFVIRPDSTAEERTLTLGARTADGLVEVKSGLEDGETIVIRGAEALRNGATVRIVKPQPGGDSLSGRARG